MSAKIYKPARTANSSGTAKTRMWMLEFDAEQARSIEPLMGWTSSADMSQQVSLWFETQEQAVAYAQRNGIAYRVAEPGETRRKILSYSDNFKVSRIGQWTH